MSAPAARAHAGGAGAPAPGRSVAAALRWADGEIAAGGCETPRLDAEVLLADALGVRRERLHLDAGEALGADAERLLADGVRRRAELREPVAYIVGRRSFRHLELLADARALVPRPETELLVEVALELDAGLSVLDLGTGSGAVALALKQERPDLRVTGSDISPRALALARENARRLGLDVAWLQADLLAGVPDEFDAIACNPPYVADGERALLAPEIVRHEPPLALFAGADGLAVIEALLGQLAGRPRVRLLALEIGAGQAAAVAALMDAAGLSPVHRRRDLAGVERVLVGRR